MEQQILLTAKGVNGQIELYQRHIRIRRAGFTALMTQGLKGDKDIRLDAISSIQMKMPGLTRGFIQFAFSGGQDPKGGVRQALHDEDTVMFTGGQRKQFELLREAIYRLQSGQEVSRVPQTAPKGNTTNWAWIGGVLLILSGLGNLREFPQFLAAPFLILAGALLLPPVWARITAKRPGLSRSSTLIRAAACILAFVVVAIVMSKPPEPKSSSLPSSSPPAAASVPTISVSPTLPSVSASPQRPWYEGGTLHRKTIKEWKSATYADRLATAADFVTATSKSRGITFTSMDQVKEQAVALEKAISTAGEGANADNQPVSDIAAACLLLMRKQ